MCLRYSEKQQQAQAFYRFAGHTLYSSAYLDQTLIRRIYVNKLENKDLKYHPYLKFKQINAIIQFRKQHGNYSNIAELKKVAILPSETVDKLAPYISFDHD